MSSLYTVGRDSYTISKGEDEAHMKEPRNPKRAVRSGSSDWYNYYASYSREFVEDAIKLMAVPSGAVVYDPWNGSGTTTKVASENGYTAIGVDVNPVMVVVARARLLAPSREAETDSLIKRLEDRLRDTDLSLVDADFDPLADWFDSDTTRLLRSCWNLLLSDAGIASPSPADSVSALNDLHSFLAVSLFGTVRHSLRSFRTSNPTWLRIPDRESRVHLSRDQFFSAFREGLKQQHQRLLDDIPTGAVVTNRGNVSLVVASSRHVVPPLPFDAIVTSPPYLTRLDYVKATAPELAVLGVTASEVRRLRDVMIGTPTIQQDTIRPLSHWGTTCNSVLEAVRNHSAKASSTYYYKTVIQYFNGMWESLYRITKEAGVGSQAAIVVQDSHYKDIHIDLPNIIVHMTQELGWRLSNKFDYNVSRNMLAVHPGNRKYRQGLSKATEVAVFLERA